jgi:predicted nucleotidyltransferase
MERRLTRKNTPSFEVYSEETMKKLDEAILQEMTGRLVSEFDPEQVILFGSHAWGVPTEDSDIDLYVVVPDSLERPLARARRALACLEGLRVPKDVLVRTRRETEKYRRVYASLESQVLEKGRVLYERH